MKSQFKVYAPLAGVTALVLVVAALSFWSFSQSETAAEARKQTYTTISRADALLSDLKDAETGERGYALTGDEHFLEPYLAARSGIQGHMEELRSLNTIGAAGQHLDALTPLVEAKLVSMSQIIDMRRRRDSAAVSATIAGGQGRRLMDSIRTEMSAFIRLQESALVQQGAELQSRMRHLFALIVTASVLMLVFAIAFAYLIYRETQHRLSGLAHLDTQHMLEVQEQLNEQLQQANNTLQISEEKLAVTLTSIGDAVITTDDEGRVTLLNPLAEKLTGWTRAEAAGRPVDEVFRIISQDTRQPSAVPVKETLARGTTQGLANHTILIARNGSECPIADSCAPIRDCDRKVIGAVLVFRDVTVEYAAQQGVRDQQFYTRSLIEANTDAIITTDLHGIISDVNQKMVALTACSRDELIGAPLMNYFTDPALAAAGIKRALNEKTLGNYELTVRGWDGTETAVSCNASTFYNRNRVLQGVFVAARDVTERNRLNQVLEDNNVELQRARAVADKANLAKSDFLSSMSHELRTPLSAILGFAQLMESGSPPPSAPQKRSIDQILKAGWYLLDLINEILDLALIESGKLSLSMEPTSLNEVMRECENLIEPQAKQHGISVVFPRLEIPYVAYADRTRLKQVIINLLSNAVKYNSAGGSVVVECSANSAQRVVIRVTDTGAGLSPEKIAQLFQPFNRLGQEMSVEEGTGIGLVVSRRLVELMDGVIHVESTVGKGSVFSIELNLTAETRLAAALPEAVDARKIPGDSPVRTLLYVEDNPANLMLVEDLIARRPDIRLLSARDGVSGIEIALASLPDLILMDINLPGISGIEALRILAEHPDTAHIPVIALSANAMARDIEKGLAAGFFRYLTKPIKVDEFMATLDSALEFAKTRAARPPIEEIA